MTMPGSPCKKVTSVRIQARFMGFSISSLNLQTYRHVDVVLNLGRLIRSESHQITEPLTPLLASCGLWVCTFISLLRDSCNKSNRSCYSVSIANILLTISYVPSTLFPRYWFASAYLFHKKTKLIWKANVQQTRRLWSGKWII